MQQGELLPHLFRTEYRKIVSVLCHLFGIAHIETAEDIVSETFLAATEGWSVDGIPENPPAWLYTVAKNKTRNYLKHDAVFRQKVAGNLLYTAEKTAEIEIDLSPKNIADSQLAMLFTVCNPVIATEAQVALALNLLCGFGTVEIADAFLVSKEVVYKRLQRAKEKLKEAAIKIEQPTQAEISDRLETVLTTIYLLFSEGYYSTSQNTVLRKEFCAEAMRLTRLLIANAGTHQPMVNALLALMCFHASRFDARTATDGEMILYDDQDEKRWNQELIDEGRYYLIQAASGDRFTRFHLEAGIAYWHTSKENNRLKWENILHLYDELVILDSSPLIALNRLFALSNVHGKAIAIPQAEKLQIENNHFYYSLLGYLYTGIDNGKARLHFVKAMELASTTTDKNTMAKHIARLDAA